MSSYLTAKSFKKEQSCIIGEIKCLGLYEVNLDKIDIHKIGNSIDFWNTIYFFQFIDDNWHKLDLHESLVYKPFIRFWNCIPSRLTGENIRVENDEVIGTIFEPNYILKLTNYTLENYNSLINEVKEFEKNQIIKGEEIEKLKELKILLEKAVESNLLIGFEYG